MIPVSQTVSVAIGGLPYTGSLFGTVVALVKLLGLDIQMFLDITGVKVVLSSPWGPLEFNGLDPSIPYMQTAVALPAAVSFTAPAHFGGASGGLTAILGFADDVQPNAEITRASVFFTGFTYTGT